MDYQGARATQPQPALADAGQPSWPAPDDPGTGPTPASGGGSYQVMDADSGPQQTLEPGSRRRHGSGRPGGPGRRPARLPLLAGAAAVILATGGYTGYKFLYQPRVNAPVSSSLRLPSTPASPGFDAALGKWQHIGSQAEDPEPLTLAQLYPPQFELNGSSYIRTAAAVSKECTLAVYGPNLQAALQSGKCTQVLRASYLSGDGTMMGTVGVADLGTFAAAQKAGQTTGPDEIIAPLAAQKGPTSKLGNGTGVVQAEIKGHYLILIWAEFANLKSPSGSAQRQQLEQFAASMVTGSANIELSTRMLTAKPAG
jgi:hypothetical protein